MPSESINPLHERIETIQQAIRLDLNEAHRFKGDPLELDLEIQAIPLEASVLPGSSLTPRELASYIEHTLLKAEATPKQILELCQQAMQYQFATACVNPRFASLAAGAMRGTPVKTCCVVGFPLGATTAEVKACEAERAIRDGASEIDMVLPIGELRDKRFRQVFSDIQQVAVACHDQGALLKVIIETSELEEELIIAACLLSRDAGADYVKTSTGFGTGGATPEDVALMRAVVGDGMGVKASGGIRNLADALEMIGAGANRLGTSSGVHIMRQALGHRIEQETVIGY